MKNSFLNTNIRRIGITAFITCMFTLAIKPTHAQTILQNANCFKVNSMTAVYPPPCSITTVSGCTGSTCDNCMTIVLENTCGGNITSWELYTSPSSCFEICYGGPGTMNPSSTGICNTSRRTISGSTWASGATLTFTICTPDGGGNYFVHANSSACNCNIHDLNYLF